MTSAYVIVSIKLCLEVGNDGYIILCNSGGLAPSRPLLTGGKIKRCLNKFGYWWSYDKIKLVTQNHFLKIPLSTFGDELPDLPDLSISHNLGKWDYLKMVKNGPATSGQQTSKGVGDREERKKGRGLGREGKGCLPYKALFVFISAANSWLPILACISKRQTWCRHQANVFYWHKLWKIKITPIM